MPKIPAEAETAADDVKQYEVELVAGERIVLLPPESEMWELLIVQPPMVPEVAVMEPLELTWNWPDDPE